MIQNQNRIINQFLQSKKNYNQFNHSIKISNSNEPFFKKNKFIPISKKFSPYSESLKEGFLNYDNNILKTSYNSKYNNNLSNYYSIKSYNHSEFITNCSSDKFKKIIIDRRDKSRTPQITMKFPPESINYLKTEEKTIKKTLSNLSNNYSFKKQENSNLKYDSKKYNTAHKEKKESKKILKNYPSQPLLFQNEYNLDDCKYNFNERPIYIQKTYNKKNCPNDQHIKLEHSFCNHSINNIHSDSEKRITIKNVKNNSMNKYNNDLSDNNLNIKDNYKYHTISVRNNKIDKEEIRIDFKNKYNINTNRKNLNDVEKINQHLLNHRQKTSPNNLINNNRIKINNRVIDNKNNENKDLKEFQNHSLFESVNLKKSKKKVLTGHNKNNNNINILLDSENDLYKNNNTINTITHIIDNKNSKKKPIRISKNFEYKNDSNKDCKTIEKLNSYKLDKRDNFDYDSNIHKRGKISSIDSKKNIVIVNDGRYNNNKISYIYEKQNLKQKSLTEINRDLKLLEDYKGNDKENKLIRNKIMNENIKRNLGNVLKKIIKKNNNNQKSKKVSIIDGKEFSDKEKQPQIKELNNKTANHKNQEKIERKIQKSNSNLIFEKKEKIIENKINNNMKNKKVNINRMEICKENDFNYCGSQIDNKDINKSQNKMNNSNIIIIINNADKNKFRKIVKTPNNNRDNNTKINNNNQNKKKHNNNINSLSIDDISLKQKINNKNNNLHYNQKKIIKTKKIIIKKSN